MIWCDPHHSRGKENYLPAKSFLHFISEIQRKFFNIWLKLLVMAGQGVIWGKSLSPFSFLMQALSLIKCQTFTVTYAGRKSLSSLEAPYWAVPRKRDLNCSLTMTKTSDIMLLFLYWISLEVALDKPVDREAITSDLAEKSSRNISVYRKGFCWDLDCTMIVSVRFQRLFHHPSSPDKKQTGEKLNGKRTIEENFLRFCIRACVQFESPNLTFKPNSIALFLVRG